ncbi:DUF3301 domain-containing protein [Pseudoalteromonas sp. T1lg76]|uniref:DUF3301 domain-containing protein n=2 Tax=Pseudoalteromonas TaxID=53246 RepID=UPI000CF706DB|nr:MULTISPECIES: DUF3301 domain-containing protein [unclassified Pseudoalteromonas]
MATLWMLMLVAAVIGLFWYQRKLAEQARIHAQHQCQQLGVQLVSVACLKWRIGILTNGKLGIRSTYLFEFSSDGESLYQGKLYMDNERLHGKDIPPHKI